MNIKYLHGDLFAGVDEAVAKGKRCVIPHVCNDEGGWGSGFVVPLGRKYPLAEQAYRQWHKNGFHKLVPEFDLNLWDGSDSVPFGLGEVQIVSGSALTSGTQPVVMIANMIGQKSTIRLNYKPIRYAAVAKALTKVYDYCAFLYNHGMPMPEIHAPKFGAGLAGGDWFVIESLICEILTDRNVPVFVYELTTEEAKNRETIRRLHESLINS